MAPAFLGAIRGTGGRGRGWGNLSRSLDKLN